MKIPIVARCVRPVVLAAFVTALVAAGCSSSSDESSRSSATAEAGDGGGETAARQVAAGGQVAQTPQAPARREIVRTGRITVATDDPVDRIAAVRALAGPGGRVGAERRSDKEISVTLLVAPDRFDETLDAVGRVGRVEDRRVDTEDVTAQVVDLELRLDGARRKAGRLRALLDRAGSLGELIEVERALGDAETEVERLESQQRSVRDRVDLATIDVTLTGTSEPTASRDIPGFSRGVRAGTATLTNVVRVAVTVIGFGLPFLAVLLPAGALLLVLRRRRRRPVAAA